MTKHEAMTKSEVRNAATPNDSFWNKDAELIIREEPERKRVYDLDERTAQFDEAIIDFAKTIPQNPIANRLVSFSANGRSGGARAEGASTRTLDRSQGAAFDLLKDLERSKE